ncbi:FAD-dependent oxidoreductase [Amphibacillus cookii]|uniref:oxidoreductase n=1 Tax=Amphibacillus cookii TaxID=767787 RepID=UPI00195E125A|nr:FAD-dependent oxidoreductase [Amphibacillus cookii]MBM7542325.1 2,4-dienoyl-CoA reductase-like NADH-dependent reductase (Old Yellow Enzyme family)/thioredoxin reductase [Amphibacillus cookii]
MLKHLFSTGRIGTMVTPNRIVMTAMGNYLANDDGSVSEKDIAFYEARAKGGVGTIITECAFVDQERGRGNSHQISVADDKYIPGLKKLSDKIHQHDGKVIVQIYHPGRQGISALNQNLPMMAPSAVECPAVHQPAVAMTKAEIAEMVEKFVDAAVRLNKADIDGVEVHGAHGYLIHEFLSPRANKRADEYGGSLENRMRFLEEIVIGIRERCGKDYPLIVRLSVEEFTNTVGHPEDGLQLPESVRIAKRLEELGVDAIDVSSGTYETMNTAWEPSSFEQGWKIHLSETIKKAVNIPVIGVAVIREPAYADQIIAEGKVDFVGSARQHFADAEWSNKAKDGRIDEIRKCISCLVCMETLMGADQSQAPCQCAINIEAGRELEYSRLKEDGDGRIVAVLGAGPAGLEAARLLAKRKFKPVVFEKNDHIGGQLELANKPPNKEKITWLIDYLKAQTEKLAVEIRLNTAPTLEELKKLNPYAIFVAQGSTPFIPGSIPGANGEQVLKPTDILSGKIKLKDKKVGVVGSGMTGLEVAHLLAEAGNDVSIFEMEEHLGNGIYFQNLMDVMTHIGQFDVAMYPKHKLIGLDEEHVSFEALETGEMKTFQFDNVVISLGTKSNTELVDEIQSSFKKVKILGDAKHPGRIRDAMEAGYLSAYNL